MADYTEDLTEIVNELADGVEEIIEGEEALPYDALNRVLDGNAWVDSTRAAHVVDMLSGRETDEAYHQLKQEYVSLPDTYWGIMSLMSYYYLKDAVRDELETRGSW